MCEAAADGTFLQVEPAELECVGPLPARGGGIDRRAAGASEALPLAREFAKAHQQLLICLRRSYGMDPAEAVREARDFSDGSREAALEGDPASLTWHDLDRLAESDPALAMRRWEDVRRAAADGLASGHRAALVVEGAEASPTERAEFLALRAAITDEWQPRGGMEQLLIDKLAQASVEEMRWLQLAVAARTDQQGETGRTSRHDGTLARPRISFAEATEQAVAMVDRWNRVFCRVLRALRDLRRFDVRVNIHGPGQVNMGMRSTRD